jgi:hypothetical protein
MEGQKIRTDDTKLQIKTIEKFHSILKISVIIQDGLIKEKQAIINVDEIVDVS